MISAGYTLRATYVVLTRTLQKRLEAYRLTSPQWYFMREIWIQEGLNQTELSKRVGTAESTTVSALRVLERRKLIYRESRPLDRRASRVYLTEVGRKLRDEVIPVINHVNEIALDGLSTADLESFDRILAHIRKNLWQHLDEINARETKNTKRAAAAANKAKAGRKRSASPAGANGTRRGSQRGASR